jgi:hypothetical protein
MDVGRRGGFETRPYMSPDPYATFAGVLTGFLERVEDYGLVAPRAKQ